MNERARRRVLQSGMEGKGREGEGGWWVGWLISKGMNLG